MSCLGSQKELDVGVRGPTRVLYTAGQSIPILFYYISCLNYTQKTLEQKLRFYHKMCTGNCPIFLQSIVVKLGCWMFDYEVGWFVDCGICPKTV